MMVAVAIFAIVMTVALGALLAMSESDRKAQTLKSVINNLNFSLDSMSRAIRTGTEYHCDPDDPAVPITTPNNCVTPETSFAFRPAGALLSERITYRLETSNGALCGQAAPNIGCIVRTTASGSSPLTSPEVYIETLRFYVRGAAQGDSLQPIVTILIAGVVTVSATQSSPFNLQTSVTQRLYDR